MLPVLLHLRPCLHRPPPGLISNPNPSTYGRRSLLRFRRSHRRSHSNASSPRFCPCPLPSLCFSNSYSASSSLRSKRPSRYAVLGAGFAGLSVAWHLLAECPKESCMRIDIYDEVGIGGGASGISGGLLHPYSPKAKLIWNGAEFWKECLKLLTIAEKMKDERGWSSIARNSSFSFDQKIVWRRGILRPATAEKNVNILKENARNCLGCCNLEILDSDAAQSLIPGLCLPFNCAVHMPLAVNIHPMRYLQALFLACQNLVDEVSSLNCEKREINLFKEPVNNLCELAGEYDSVIICLGAKVDMLPELSRKLPLRTCRGIVAQLQLPAHVGGEYSDRSPSILSDAWLAFQGPRNVFMGSTWDWKSKDYSSSVSEEEASRAMENLLPKASAAFPAIRNWAFVGAGAGLRAMPPLTPYGSLPLLGCVNDIIGVGDDCMYWLVGALGSRGLLYHGLLGKWIAKAVISCNESVIPYEFTSWKMGGSKENHVE